MSQLGKWFPCKPEDLISNPQPPCKKQGVMASTCNTNTAEEETVEDPWGLLTSQFRWICELQVQACKLHYNLYGSQRTRETRGVAQPHLKILGPGDQGNRGPGEQGGPVLWLTAWKPECWGAAMSHMVQKLENLELWCQMRRENKGILVPEKQMFILPIYIPSRGSACQIVPLLTEGGSGRPVTSLQANVFWLHLYILRGPKVG